MNSVRVSVLLIEEPSDLRTCGSVQQVWRIYPYATDEVIGLNLLTFFSNSPPQLVAALRTIVAAVFFDSSSMLHSVVTYDLKTKRV